MAEAIAVIGTAGALVNIVDVLSKTIKTLNDLHSSWKDADFILLCLVSELGALRTALANIQEWVDTNEDADLHHQLIIDLGHSLSCCRILISKIDGQLSELQQNQDEKLVFTSKLRFLFGSKGMEELQKVIQRQTSALTLLLTACNCKALSKQKLLLEKPRTQRIFRKIQIDTESLVVLRDKDSILSIYTDNLSKFSREFVFDAELFISRVYDRVIRASLKGVVVKRNLGSDLLSEAPQQEENLDDLHIIGKGQPPKQLGLDQKIETSSVAGMKQADRIKFQVQIPKIRISRTEEDEAKKRSAAIDRRLEEDSKRFRREVKILLLGSGDSGKEEIVKQMKIIHLQGLSENELYNYRPTIFNNVINSAKAIIQAMDQFDITPELEVNKGYCEYLMGYNFFPESPCLEAKVGKAIFSIWNDPCIEKLMEHRHEFYLIESANYFFEEVERIAAPYYLPNEVDVLRARTKSNGIYETRFQMGELSIHLFDVGGQRSERKKWIHSFENVNTIIFVVNLSDYDQVLLEESSQNAMMESLLLFDSVVNSRWFQRTSIVLLLNKVDVFREKLARSPLSNYFPDYSGGNDVNKAAKYILWRFNQVNRAHLPLYPHLVQATDTSNIRLVFAAIKETILNNALRGSGIFG